MGAERRASAHLLQSLRLHHPQLTACNPSAHKRWQELRHLPSTTPITLLEEAKAGEDPYWSEELLAVLVVGLGDETQARETLEGIIQQALSGRALQGISEEALASWGG